MNQRKPFEKDDVARLEVFDLYSDDKTAHKVVALPKSDIEQEKDNNAADEYKFEIDEKNMSMEFPFTLDPFQRIAVACVQNEQSVLVSAHTSAGKTVVALYTISQVFFVKIIKKKFSFYNKI